MKLFFLVPFVLLVSCSSVKNPSKSNVVASAVVEDEAELVSLQSTCPMDGKCTIEIVKGKSMKVLSDEIGALYYQIEDNSETSIIKYKYIRNVPKGLQDADYVEEVIFEIPTSFTKINKSDFELQSTKMLFRRMCFCRGQTGFYKIEKGILNLVNKANDIQIKLDFKMNQVPQIITSFDYTIKKY